MWASDNLPSESHKNGTHIFFRIIFLSAVLISLFIGNSCNQTQSTGNPSSSEIEKAVKEYYGAKATVTGVSPRRLDDSRYLVDVLIAPQTNTNVQSGSVPLHPFPVIYQKFEGSGKVYWKVRALTDLEILSLKETSIPQKDDH
jgi:hypothetical protein